VIEDGAAAECLCGICSRQARDSIVQLQQFSYCCREKAHLSSGFFLTEKATLHGSENATLIGELL
jgi:hypothetical protein